MMLVASAIVGVLAALWPAIRAARTRPLEAIVEQ
jgi:putative ABC transport system permease protein